MFFKKKQQAPSPVAKRVARGMEFLDRNRPGWFRDVGVYALDIARGDRCVLGQLYGSYNYGKIHHDLTYREARDLGFQTSVTSVFGGIDAEYEALTAEWREQIINRRKKVKV